MCQQKPVLILELTPHTVEFFIFVPGKYFRPEGSLSLGSPKQSSKIVNNQSLLNLSLIPYVSQLISNEGRCEEGHTDSADAADAGGNGRQRRRRRRRRRRRKRRVSYGSDGDPSFEIGRPNLHPRNTGNRRNRQVED